MQEVITHVVTDPLGAAVLLLIVSATSSGLSWLLARFTGLGDILVRRGFAMYESRLDHALETHKAALQEAAHRYTWFYDRQAQAAAEVYEKLATAVTACEAALTPDEQWEYRSGGQPQQWSDTSYRDFFSALREADLHFHQKRLFLDPDVETAAMHVLTLLRTKRDGIADDLPIHGPGPTLAEKEEFLARAPELLEALKRSLRAMLREAGGPAKS